MNTTHEIKQRSINAIHEKLERILKRLDRGKCTWTHDESMCVYRTACGETFQFFDGSPESNGAKYCQYCGEKIKLDD